MTRLALVAALTIPAGLACSGGSAPIPVPAPLPPPPPVAPVEPLKRLVGSWRAVPDELRLRQLKIISAAITGRPQKIEKLGELTLDEKDLFDQWKGKSGPEARDKQAELRKVEHLALDFTGTEVTVHLGEDETYGPVTFTVIDTTDQKLTLQFDPGQGNGVETHAITWQDDDRGTDDISSAGKSFEPLTLERER